MDRANSGTDRAAALRRTGDAGVQAVADRIKVAAVDAQPLYRQGLANALAGSRLLQVAEGATAEDALEAVRSGDPDVLLIDVEVPGDGMAAAEKVLRTRPGVKVVILTACDTQEYVSDALRMGVHGYILKDVSGPELVSAIEAIHRGEPYITPALASRLLMQSRGRPLVEQVNGSVELTRRDRQLLGFLATGLTNQEIALSLGMNVRTVKHYLTQVFRKMRVRNRVEAILEAQRLRLEPDGRMPPSAQSSVRR